MAIRFRCHRCSESMSIASRKAGAIVECPKCREKIVVPQGDVFEPQPKRSNVLQATGSNRQSLDPERSDEQSVLTGSGGVFSSSAAVGVKTQCDDSGEDGDNVAAALPDVTNSTFMLSRRKRSDDEMDLTPMVDVTFQLLIFFMVSASFAMQKTIKTPSTDPDQKGATQQMQTLNDFEGTSILVKIDASNVLFVDDEQLSDPSKIADILRAKMRSEQKTELLLSAHAAALHRGVIAVIDAANEVGMQKIRLASGKTAND